MRELEGCSFKHFYGKWIAKFPKSSRKGKKSTNRRQAHFDRPLREIQTRETGLHLRFIPQHFCTAEHCRPTVRPLCSM